MSVERHGAVVRLTQNVMHSLVAVLIQLEKCEFKILLGHIFRLYMENGMAFLQISAVTKRDIHEILFFKKSHI